MAVKEPSPGETWRLSYDDGNGNPFDVDDIRVRVLEVRYGWVRYTHGICTGDSHKSIEDFVGIMSIVEGPQ